MQPRFSRVDLLPGRARARTGALRRALLGLTVLGGVACAGTPLPEPPDELPAPDFDDFMRDAVFPASMPDRPSVLIGGARPGTVQAGSRVWFINLDSSDAPIEVSADAQGGLTVPPIAALPGERIRVISRTDRQHSAPLDLQVTPAEVSGAPSTVMPLSAPTMDCLRVTPAPTLLLRGSQGALRIQNRCENALSFARVALRFGDQGLMLSTPPAELAAGAQVSLSVRDVQGPGAAERLDIVLIDAQADDGATQRLAIDVFSALE